VAQGAWLSRQLPFSLAALLDGRNRVFGHEGLYVVDGSMMPANLGVNPSLTITAMAEHAMSYVPAKPKPEAG